VPTTFLVEVALRAREGMGDLRLLKMILLLLFVLLPPPLSSPGVVLFEEASKGCCCDSVGVMERGEGAALSGVAGEGDPALARRLFVPDERTYPIL
jgi:hypothetical protein